MSPSKEWQLQEAKNCFSEVVRLAQSTPQTVTLRGEPSAVVVSYKAYRAMTAPKKSLLEVMRAAPEGFSDLDLSRSADGDMREAGL